MHDDAARRSTALARRPERGPEDSVERELEIGVLHHDDRVLAAELEVDVLEVICGIPHHRDAGLARAGERNHRDVWMPDEPVADRAAPAVDDVDDPLRNAGFVEQLDEALPERRCVGRRLEDDRVSGDECGCDLPRGDRNREVPRRDDADDADGHPDRHVELVRELGGRRLAEEAPAFAAHVVAHVDRFLHVAAGLRLDLPHLVGHQIGDLGLVLVKELREAEEDLAATWSRHESPVLERLFRSSDGTIDVLGARLRERPDELAVGGARAVEGLSRGGIHPRAADVVLKLSDCRGHAASLKPARQAAGRLPWAGTRSSLAPCRFV